MKRKRVAAVMLAAAMAVSLAGCGGNASSSTTSSASGNGNSVPTEDAGQTTAGEKSESEERTAASEPVDKVVIGLTASSFDVSPFGSGSIPRHWIVQNLYAVLFSTPYYGAPLEELEPWMAKGVEKIDDVTYAVELNDYILDSKGNAITSEDIVFSFDHMYTEGQNIKIGTYLDNIEIVDDYNMIFHLKKSGPGVIEYLMGDYTLAICDKSWFESASDDEKRRDPATTGAYKVASYTPGAEIILEANEDYWQTNDNLRNKGDIQNVKRIEYKVITEASMRSIALENHEIDATIVDAGEVKRFYDGTKPLDGWNVRITGGVYCYAMFANMDSGKSVLSDDLNLRNAVMYALDSESILYGGNYDETTGEVCYSLGTSVMSGYQESWKDDNYFTYDPEKAKEYYKASGHADGEVKLRLLSRTSIPDGVHSVIIANLEAAGFKVELLSYDQALFNTYKFDSTQWDIMLDNKGSGGHIAAGWDMMFNPDGYKNGSCCFTHDDKLVELLMAASTTGTAENIQAYHEYLQEIACVKGLYTINNLMVGQDGILNLEINGNMMPRVNAFVFAEDYKSVAE